MEENKVTNLEKVIIIGGSAGSLDVLLNVLPLLTHIEKIAIVIVLHRKNSDDNVLEELLRMKCTHAVKEIEDKTKLRPGRIHVAPADYHLLFESDQFFSLDVSEKIHYSRPSIDIAFLSAAEIYGNKLLAILLSGANADGTDGLRAVKENNGTVVIQSPETADVPYMPEYALKHVTANFVLSPAEIVSLINTLCA